MKVILCLCALIAATFAGAPSNIYLPSHQDTASVPEPSFQAAPAVDTTQSFSLAASAPAPSFQPDPEPAPAASFDTAASEPVAAHTFSADDGYRYKTHRRIVYRHRRNAPSSEYLPPQQGAAFASLPSNEYLPPQQGAAFGPEIAFSSASDQGVVEPAPAHSFSSADGYRYKTQRRRVVRRRFRY